MRLLEDGLKISLFKVGLLRPIQLLVPNINVTKCFVAEETTLHFFNAMLCCNSSMEEDSYVDKYSFGGKNIISSK